MTQVYDLRGLKRELYILSIKPRNNKSSNYASTSGKKVEKSKQSTCEKDQSSLDSEILQRVINKLSNEIIDLNKGKNERPYDRGNFKQSFKRPPTHKPPNLNEGMNTRLL